MNLKNNILLDKEKQTSELFIHLNSDLVLCGFTEETKHGFLFFLGAALPAILPESLFGSIKDEEVVSRILNSYTPIEKHKVDAQFNDDPLIDVWFKVAEFIVLRQAIKTDLVLSEEELKSIAIEPYNVFVKAMHNLQTDYRVIDYNINSLTNFYSELFQILGNYLFQKECSYESSYRAGITYFQSHVDDKFKLVDTLINLERTIPPLYKALFYSPIAYILQYKQFKSNHLFSLVFFFFTIGMPDNILRPIHIWHQVVFYENTSANIREMWNFEINTSQMALVFANAMDIRRQYPDLIPLYLKNNDLAMPELKNQKRTQQQLFDEMSNAMYSKYDIQVSPTGWNHRGEFIQFLAILFYETCLHTMVLSEIQES